jgi:AraC-like DNA-binding protein
LGRGDKSITHYREHAPSAAFSHVVECYWTLEVTQTHQHLIVPDGCLDLLFTWQGRRLKNTLIIGSMTRPQTVSLVAGQFISGIRFRPGLFSAALQVPIAPLTDRQIELSKASTANPALVDALHSVTSFEDCICRVEESMQDAITIRPTQKAIHELYQRSLEATKDRLTPAELADKIQLSERQFRRVCLQETGLSPKALERIARFRRAWLALQERRKIGVLEIAQECGYSDQAHLIRDFREFAGMTPGRYLKSQL